MKRVSVLLIPLLMAVTPADADVLNKGDREVAFDLSYSRTDLGSQGPYDFGKQTHIDLNATHGWYLTRHHELGLLLAYARDDISSSNVYRNQNVDSREYGIFYHYNLQPAGRVSPYFGVSAATLRGDGGDLYDYVYAARIGFKAYMFDHAGIIGGIGWSRFSARDESTPDATAIVAAAGLLFKY